MFRFTIIDFTTDPAGIETVVDEPVGWDGITINLKRDKNWHGFFEFFDDSLTSLEFYGEGFQVLKSAYDSFGVEAKVDLLIEYACSETDEFAFLYQGRFAFKRAQFICGLKCYASIGVEASDCLMKFRNRYEQKVDLEAQITEDRVCINPVEVQVRFINSFSQINFIGTEFPSLMPGDQFTISGSQFNNQTFTVTSSNLFGGGTETTVAEFVEDEGTEYEFVDCVVCVEFFELPDYDGIGFDVTLPGKKIQTFGESIGFGDDYEINYEFDFTGEDINYGTSTLSLLAAYSNFNLKKTTSDFNELNDTEAGVYCDHPTECEDPQVPSIYDFDANTKIKCSGQLLVNLRIKGVYNDDYQSIVTTGLFYIELRKGADLETSSIEYQYLHNYTKSQFGTDNIAVDWQLVDQPIFLTANEKLWLVSGVSLARGTGAQSNTGNAGFTVDSSSCFFDLKITSQCLPTQVKSYYINEVFSRLAENYTNDCFRVYSEYFGRTDSEPYSVDADGCGSNEVLTNGLLIRNAKLTDGTEPSLKVSFKETFEAMKAVHNIGMGLEVDADRVGYKRLRIEPYKHFYNDTVLFVLDSPAEVKRVVNDSFVNMIKIGYQKWEAEETNGLYDLFGNREYKTIISAARGNYDQLCKFIASDYAIEVTRREFGTTTKDWKYDNDAFIICVQKGLFIECANFIEVDEVSGLENTLNVGSVGTDVFHVGDSITVTGSDNNDLTFTIDAVVVLPFNPPITILVLSGNDVTYENCVNIRIFNNTRPITTTEIYDVAEPATIQNVLLPETAFNLRITPIRNLLRHYPSIAESLSRNADKLLYFTDGNGNIKARINLAANHTCVQENNKMLAENDTITRNDFASDVARNPIAYNETVEIEYPLNKTQFQAVLTNPYGLVGWNCADGNIEYGWIIDLKYQPRSGMTEFVLKPKIES